MKLLPIVLLLLANITFAESKLSIISKISRLDGFEVSSQEMGNNIYNGLILSGGGTSEAKAFASFMKYNLDKYDHAGYVDLLSSSSLEQSELDFVYRWHSESSVARKLKERNDKIRKLSEREVSTKVIGFTQDELPNISKERAYLLTQIVRNSSDIEKGVEFGMLVYDLSLFFKAKGFSRSPASSEKIQREQVQEKMSSLIFQTTYLTYAFTLKNFSNIELETYLSYLESKEARKFNSLRNEYLLRSASLSLRKAMSKWQEKEITKENYSI